MQGTFAGVVISRLIAHVRDGRDGVILIDALSGTGRRALLSTLAHRLWGTCLDRLAGVAADGCSSAC